jgi:subtilisin family serine protease
LWWDRDAWYNAADPVPAVDRSNRRFIPCAKGTCVSRRAPVLRLLSLITLTALIVPISLLNPPRGTVATASQAIAPPPIDNRYIVVLRDDLVGAAEVADEFTAADADIHVSQVYQSALNGFAAEIPPDRLVEMARDPRVVSIEPDRRIYPQAQTLPKGANRIDADHNKLAKIDGKDGTGERVNADIAILDMGVGPHSDLNVVGGHDCTGGGFLTDDGGHGTHVAGIAGAIDNGSGIVGVAPGVRLWSVRVLDDNDGSWSWVICGLDWVTAHAGTIDVANMSLGEPFGPDPTCNSTALHRAVCNTVAAGVTVVVAAGNYPGGTNAQNGVPAQYPEVITVSAIADSDGKPGGLGPATSAGLDDHRADFSAWGAVVDIAAPGVDTYSTAPGGGFSVMSGTSFATPHVAGAAALYIAKHGRVGPAAVKAGLLAERERGHIPGDPDGIDEGIVNVGDLRHGSLTLGTSRGKPRDHVGYSLSNFKKQSQVELQWDGTTLLTVTTNSAGAASGEFTVPATPKGLHLVRAVAADHLASAPFRVNPLLVVSPTTGPAYHDATITLRGYARYEHVTVTFAEGSDTIKLATIKCSISGSANAVVKIPSAFAGSHQITGVGTTGSSARTTYTVKPSLRLRPQSAGAGETFVATLRGFAASGSVTLRWYQGSTSKTLASGTATVNGGRVFTVAVPADAAPGVHRVETSDTAGHLVAATFRVLGSSSTSEQETTPAPTTEPTQETTPEPTATSTPEPSPTAEPTDESTEPASSPDATTPTPTEAATPDEAQANAPEPYRVVRGTQNRGADRARPAVDGDPTTIWYATGGEAPLVFVQFDLGAVKPIGEIRWLVGDAAAIAGMEIQVSTDRRTWSTIGTPQSGSTGDWQVFAAVGVEARYVRFAFPEAAEGVAVGGIAEVEIYPPSKPET